MKGFFRPAFMAPAGPRSPAEKDLVRRLDIFLMTFGCISQVIKYLDASSFSGSSALIPLPPVSPHLPTGAQIKEQRLAYSTLPFISLLAPPLRVIFRIEIEHLLTRFTIISNQI